GADRPTIQPTGPASGSERAPPGPAPWPPLVTPAANATSWSNTGLAAASTWYYRVKATNAAGDSAPSNVDSASTSDIAPAAPSALTATAISSSRIDLAWTDNSSNQTGFKFERAGSASGPFSQIGTSLSGSFSDTSAPAATTSYYRVSAYNAAGSSVPSNVASAPTPDNPPAAPSALGATAISSSRIDLIWTDNS